MNYTYPEIRDVLMILAKRVLDGRTAGNTKYTGKIVLTPRTDKDVNVLVNFLAKNGVKSNIEQQSMGRVVVFDFGQVKGIDTTINEMIRDEQHMKNVDGRLFHASVNMALGREDR